MSLTEQEMQQLKKLLSKLTPAQAERVVKDPSFAKDFRRPEIPAFWWNSNLNAFKSVLKKVEEAETISEQNLVKFLREGGLVSSTATPKNYGYTYNQTGIFMVGDDGTVSLTDIGKRIAQLFNNDYDLTALEIVICRGLQSQAAGYAYLGIVSTHPGISRQEVMDAMVTQYGGEGRYYTGYYTRIYKQLKLIDKRTVDGKAHFWVTVPEAWSGAMPEVEEEEQ